MKIIKYVLLVAILLLTTLKLSALATNSLLYANDDASFITVNKTDGIKVVSSNKNDGRIHQENKIIRIWIGADGLLNVIAEIKDNKEEVKIVIYNMLGKEIRKIYQGFPLEKDSDDYYKFASQSPLTLPNNIYILVIQGVSYKIADKFVISNR